MNRGGNYINERVDRIIQLVGIAVPPFLLFHVMLLTHNVIPTDRPISAPFAYSLLALWFVMSLYHYYAPSKNRISYTIHIVLYHIFAACYLLFVCGLGSPVVYLWALLPVAAYQYIGVSGYAFSMAAFIILANIEAMIHGASNERLIGFGMTFLGVVAIGTVVTIIADELVRESQRIAKEQAREHLQTARMTTIINNLADAIIATNAQGVIDTYNAAALSLLDTNHALTDQPVNAVLKLTNEDGKKVSVSKLLASATKVESRDDLQLKLQGETVRLSLIYSPIKSMDSTTGEPVRSYIIIMRDITRQKSLEEERDEFISVVSHELRTPITIAEGALSNVQLMQSRDIATPQQIESGISMAHEQVVFLAGMINDLSTLSRAERGVMSEHTCIKVEPFMHDLYNQYVKEATKQKLQFNLDLDPQIGCVEQSELYMHELMQNFITNALKYTKTGSITIGAHKNGGEITFFVKDTGIGISKNDQSLVFNKFFRSEDYRTRETSGTGLGLYVAKKLSHLMGTKIELQSRLNHGSTFQFTLPAGQHDKK